MSDSSRKCRNKCESQQGGTGILTTRPHAGWAPCQQAAGSFCSWEASVTGSSPAPTRWTRTARRSPHTAGTSWSDSVGLRLVGFDTLPYTAKTTGLCRFMIRSMKIVSLILNTALNSTVIVGPLYGWFKFIRNASPSDRIGHVICTPSFVTNSYLILPRNRFERAIWRTRFLKCS